MRKDETVFDPAKALTRLAQACRDGEQGYRTAAEVVHDDDDTRVMFEQLAQQRADMANELGEIARSLGGEREDQPTLMSNVFTGWVKLHAALSTDDTQAALDELDRSENWVQREFEDVLDSGLEGELRPLVERHFIRVREARDRIHTLSETRRTWGRR